MSKLNRGDRMNTKLTAIRHGEVLLRPVDTMPKGKVGHVKTYIVGHSETGHHHILESKTDFDVVMDKLEVYLMLTQDASLVHKKKVNAHKTLTVPAGIYKITHKTEYDPWAKIKRPVFD